MFYVLGAIAVVASAMVIGQRKPVYSVMMLIASFIALAGLYVLLDAPFVAVIQIIIYAGAIVVLFLFVVMLLNAPTEGNPRLEKVVTAPRRAGVVLSGIFVLELAFALWAASAVQPPAAAPAATTDISSVRVIGQVLYT